MFGLFIDIEIGFIYHSYLSVLKYYKNEVYLGFRCKFNRFARVCYCWPNCVTTDVAYFYVLGVNGWALAEKPPTDRTQ